MGCEVKRAEADALYISGKIGAYNRCSAGCDKGQNRAIEAADWSINREMSATKGIQCIRIAMKHNVLEDTAGRIQFLDPSQLWHNLVAP